MQALDCREIHTIWKRHSLGSTGNVSIALPGNIYHPEKAFFGKYQSTKYRRENILINRK